MKRKIALWITPIILAVIIVFVGYRQSNKDYYDFIVMSGATPLAVSERVPSDFKIDIEGFVKRDYHLSGDALNALATTRVRTREISPEGEYQGAYIYMGIPVFNIFEGIAPEKPETYIFNGPIDILVTFHSSSGKTSRFSFNEILMVDDRTPVTLAYSREELLPTNEKVKATYDRNIHRDDLTGFRLICPKEPDTSRYLNNVVRVTYSVIPVNDDALPVRKKKFKCVSDSVTCMSQSTDFDGAFDGVKRIEIPKWVRVGHGHGYDDIASASGYELRSFLKRNFMSLSLDDFFLFVACDGYRALFSAREIFATEDGEDMLIVDSINGERPKEGYMMAPTKDFFHDRAMWGVSHVVWLR